MNTNIIGYEGMESAQLEVHMVAATMAQERYIDLKRQSRRAIDKDVKEGLEAKAEQAGNDCNVSA